ncbi:MAG: hypothetical protein SNJ75_04645 [Gemmataceae bacterium]
MPQSCPRCHRVHPDLAAYCHFDGTALRQADRPDNAGVRGGQFSQDFVFASGRRCRNFEELSQACYAEWDTARSLLSDGIFANFFAALGRVDLLKLTRECQTLRDPDIGLSQFLKGLPVTTTAATPRLGLSPRRLHLGPLRVGDQEIVLITLKNEGTGQLQGKLQVADGEEWLSLEEETIRTPREQVIRLHVNTRQLTAGQSYAGRLVAITNGGAAELPVKLEVQARPFALAPYQGATSPRDLARKMRDNPKPAVELLTNGEVKLWFASNGWNYPIVGQPAPGLACVQQYFEELGLAKAPVIRISHERIEMTPQANQMHELAIVLTSVGRKLVYARAESNVPWLRLKQPYVSGQASATLEVVLDTSLMDVEKLYVGAIKVIANANQTFIVPVRVTVQGKPALPTQKPSRVESPKPAVPALPPVRSKAGITQPAAPRSMPVPPLPVATQPAVPLNWSGEAKFSLKQAIFVGAILGLLGRTLLVLPADLYARVLVNPQRSPLPGSLEAWLMPPSAEDGFLRLMVGVTWWLGPLISLWAVARSGGKGLDYLCALITGAGLGLAGMATVGSLLVVGDGLPRLVLSACSGATLPALVATVLWIGMCLICWFALGAAGGAVLKLIGPVGQGVLRLMVTPLAGLLHLAGLEKLARLLEPQRS